MSNRFFSYVSIISITLIIPMIIPVSFSEVFSTDTQWHKVYQLGKFHDPQKKDQIFISGYKITNGTITELKPGAGAFYAHINSDTNATLYYKVPRNFPYTNSIGSYGRESPVVMMDVPPFGSPQKDFMNVKKIHLTNKTDDCFFTFPLQFSGNHTVQFAFVYLTSGERSSYGDNIPQSCNGQTIAGYLPPLKQIQAGVDPYFVTCKQDLELVIKLEGKSTACIKTTSLDRLLKQGWVDAHDNNGKYRKIETPNTIKIQDSDFLLNYSITGGSIEESKLDSQTPGGIVMLLKATNNGALTVTIPRALLDMIHDSGSKFIVLADGQQIEFKQIHSTMTDRTFLIPFQNGTSRLMILVSHY